MKKSGAFAAVLIACTLFAPGFSASKPYNATFTDTFTLPTWEYVLFDHNSTATATLCVTVTNESGVSTVISFGNSITA